MSSEWVNTYDESLKKVIVPVARSNQTLMTEFLVYAELGTF